MQLKQQDITHQLIQIKTKQQCSRVNSINIHLLQLDNFLLNLYRKVQKFMAFVARSPKSSYFTHQQLSSENSQPKLPPQTTKPDKRIHLHHSYKHIFYKQRKKIDKQEYQKNIKQSEIQYNNQVLHFYDIDKTEKINYNFNHLKKRKRYPKTQPNDHNDQSHLPQAFYEMPSSISKLTMVKYVKPSNQNNKQNREQLPGPATYQPKNQNNAQSHRFQSAELARCTEIKSKDTVQYCSQQKSESYPVIRYQTMNSSTFKKTPNLINYWNRVLLKKLFHHKSSIAPHKQDQQQQDQSIKKEQNTTINYDYISNLKRSNSYQFSIAKRFKTNPSQGSRCFYQINSSNPNKSNNENANFLSQVQRFTPSSPSQLPLQYQNCQKSLLHSTKNRKYIPFDSRAEKSFNQNQIDARPYYDIFSHQKNGVRFSQVSKNRCNFEEKNDDGLGPGTYDVRQSWNREFGCVINRAITPKFATKSEVTVNPNERQQTFFLASPSTNHLQNAKSKINNKFFRPQANNKKVVAKIFKQQIHKFYNIAPQWEKKSFNKYFSDEIISANNPIKNKVF